MSALTTERYETPELLEAERDAAVLEFPTWRVQPAPSSLRLTRRGRVVVLVAGLLTLLAVAFASGSGSVATEHPGQPVPTRIVVVQPGQTLWSIAQQASDGGDVRATVDRIQELNAMDSAAVTAGQRIRIPR